MTVVPLICIHALCPRLSEAYTSGKQQLSIIYTQKRTMVLYYLLAASLMALCTCVDNDAVVNLAKSNTAFGFNLLNVIQDDEGGNVFLSPFSISTALAMTYLGADGNTQDQLATGLQIGSYKNPIELFKNLNERLFNQQAADGYVLRQANKLYGDKETTFKADFLNGVRKYFHSPLFKVDFLLDSTREDINLWVAEKTEQKIKDLLAEGDLRDAIMVLINAIYFKASWLKPFDGQATSKRMFHITPSRSTMVDMMRHALVKKFNIGVVPGISAQILEMKYKGGMASMFIILPDESVGLCEVQEGLTMNKLEEAIDGMEEKTTRLQVPKFELKDRIKLKKYLLKLNMTDMFHAKLANFSKITDESHLVVSNVIHQSFVRVDENGTVAAAATAPIFVPTSLQQAESFIVNKPFLFLIRDLASKSVLFLGRVVDPTDAEDLGLDGYQCQPTAMVYTAQEPVAGVVHAGNGADVHIMAMCATILLTIFVTILSKW